MSSAKMAAILSRGDELTQLARDARGQDANGHSFDTDLQDSSVSAVGGLVLSRDLCRPWNNDRNINQQPCYVRFMINGVIKCQIGIINGFIGHITNYKSSRVGHARQIWATQIVNPYHIVILYSDYVLLSDWHFTINCHYQIDGLVQDYGISRALAMEILQSCIKPSKLGISMASFLIQLVWFIYSHKSVWQ